jgi:cell division septum initiation protein DivIVA
VGTGWDDHGNLPVEDIKAALHRFQTEIEQQRAEITRLMEENRTLRERLASKRRSGPA